MAHEPTPWMPAWQRLLIVAAFGTLVPGLGRAIGGVAGTLILVACGLICLAAIGFVELGMALWYRGRRAWRHRGGAV